MKRGYSRTRSSQQPRRRSSAESGGQSAACELDHERDQDDPEQHGNGDGSDRAHDRKVVVQEIVEVVIYTRRDCPLCDSGIALAVSVFGEENITLVDVDLELGFMGKYTNRVPVIETLYGVVIDEGMVTEATLREFSSRR